ncbi:MAG TPA: methyltransferase [Candidatus Binatia bacterium]|nr:methyltransferase [Candidatus Binatia bacterium]
MQPDLLVADFRRDGGSFRDPDGYILRNGERIVRVVLPGAVERWRQFAASGLAAELQSLGLLVATREIFPGSADPAIPGGSILLEHERIPFTSYPYEWSFGMLREAALLHLDILQCALRHNWILKDATPYNVQFRGVTPLFIDVLSFAPLQRGDCWAGYNQFCRTMLYPLMLEAHKQVPFQPWLRSELEGIDPVVFSNLFRGLERRRPGVLSHVTAQAWLMRKFAAAGYSVRQQISSAGMTPQMIARNVLRLRKLVLKLRPASYKSAWSDYSRDHYAAEALAQKEAFVNECVAGRRFELVWDLGCNDGRFSRIVAGAASTVLAVDSDAGSIERLYGELRKEQRANILPLLMNLANPSPSQGWASGERTSLVERGKPDLTLALALVHHLVITANIPVAAVVGWLAETTRELVIEFISKDDAMVRRLLLNKDDTYADYSRAAFERRLEERFRIGRRLELPGGTRFLYHATAAN